MMIILSFFFKKGVKSQLIKNGKIVLRSLAMIELTDRQTCENLWNMIAAPSSKNTISKLYFWIDQFWANLHSNVWQRGKYG